jgi:hypothetical protein
MRPSKEKKFGHVTGPAWSISPPLSGSFDASVPLDLSSHDSAKDLPEELARVSATEDCAVGDRGLNTIGVG